MAALGEGGHQLGTCTFPCETERPKVQVNTTPVALQHIQGLCLPHFLT